MTDLRSFLSDFWSEKRHIRGAGVPPLGQSVVAA